MQASLATEAAGSNRYYLVYRHTRFQPALQKQLFAQELKKKTKQKKKKSLNSRVLLQNLAQEQEQAKCNPAFGKLIASNQMS